MTPLAAFGFGWLCCGLALFAVILYFSEPEKGEREIQEKCPRCGNSHIWTRGKLGACDCCLHTWNLSNQHEAKATDASKEGCPCGAGSQGCGQPVAKKCECEICEQT